MKTSRLTDKHFNSRNVQRFHKYLNRDRSWGTFLLSLLVLPTFLAATLGEVEPDFLEWYLICLSPCGYCVNYIFVMCVGFTVQAVSHIFYRPPSSKSEIILINPDGNPEMCKITKYPAFDFYGYRLPNAGDIKKIEKFMKYRKIYEIREAACLRDNLVFDKKKFLAYTSKALL